MRIKIEKFEGPYDLLLNLISEQKLDIGELAISEVTEQYLNYLDELEEAEADELADFLVIATKLLLLKSKLLLPKFLPEEDEGPSLEDQLKLYQAFVLASKTIAKVWLDKKWGAFRLEPPHPPEKFAPPQNFAMADLHESMVELIDRLKPPKALPHTHIEKSVTIKEKIDFVRKLLKTKKSFSFSELLKSGQNKTEIIMGFLALLELVKGEVVGLKQQGMFGEIVVEKVK